MANLDNDLFNRLLNEGKVDEAKNLLKTFIDSEWTQADEGEHYVSLITNYMELSNKVNSAYIEEMEIIKSQLDQLDQIKDATEKNFEMNKIREKISNL